MSIEGFQILDNETTGDSITKRDLSKLYHQQAANLNDSDQSIEFIFKENNNYHHIGNAYLQNDLAGEQDVTVAANRFLVNGNIVTLVNSAFAYCFKEARLSTTGGSDIEHNEYVGQISTVIVALTSKAVDLISHLEKT